MTPCSSPLFFLGYFFLNSVVPMLRSCASFGVGGRASSRPWAWPRRRWFGGEVLLTVFWGLTPWTHAVKPVAKRKQSHALARPRRTTRPPCSRTAFTVAGASRPRASTPGSRSTASGSSAATRTSPTRPGTATTTHASTTGSKLTYTLAGDSSPDNPLGARPRNPNIDYSYFPLERHFRTPRTLDA